MPSFIRAHRAPKSRTRASEAVLRQSPGLVISLLAVLFALSPCGSASAQCTPDWDVALGTPGADGEVFASAVYDDGTGPALYVGGAFTSIGGVATPSRLARFDGTTWSAVGSGVIANGSVRALTVYDDGSGPRLFVGGQFSGIGGSFISRVGAYDGTTWSDLGGGMEGAIVYDFAAFDDGTGTRLYACGSFQTAGGNFAEGLAGWNGVTWLPAGNGSVSGEVFAVHTHDLGDGSGPALYVGGFFTSIGSVGATNIARFDGTTFSPLGLGVNNTVWALESFGSTLIAGGDFTQADIVPAPYVAAWDSIGWSSLLVGGGGADATVFVLEPVTVDGAPRLALGGSFSLLGTLPASRIATFDGVGFQALGAGCDADVRSLDCVPTAIGAIPGGLYVGGSFSLAGGVSAVRLARYDTCPPVVSVFFERGDANADGSVNIADAIFTLSSLFSPSGAPLCDEALDVNDDGGLNIADAIFLLGSLFVPSADPVPPPTGSCGADTDLDSITCELSNPAC